jgi:8-oxo-dGTP pyrophosphatase MutT (NUDIX family)
VSAWKPRFGTCKNPPKANVLDHLEQLLQTRQRRELQIPEFRRAAVLVGVLDSPKPALILTRRTSTLSTHSGQIAFAGGSMDAFETPSQTALREAWEEIGLEPSLVRVLGLLDDVWTPAGFHVTPVLGVVSSGAQFSPNPAEVAQLLFVPLEDLAQIPVQYEHKILPASSRVPSFETRDRAVPHYLWGDVDIWGMTAFVIGDLLGLLEL